MSSKKPQQKSAYSVEELENTGIALGDFYERMRQEQQGPAPDEKKAPERSLLGAINDTIIDTGNAAAGLVKAGVDLFAPDSSVSGAIDSFIKDGQSKQSDKKKYLREKLSTDFKKAGESDGTTSGEIGAEFRKAGTYLRHAFMEDPLGTLGEIAGNIGPFAMLGRGLQAAMLSEGVRTAVAAGVAGSMSAGEVRGSIWGRINSTSDADLRSASPAYAALRESGMSEDQAKRELGANFARNLPEVAVAGLIGALGGKYGMEGMAAGVAPKMGRLGAAAVGFLDEGPLQGGAEQIASNVGVQRVMPEQKLYEDVLQNAVAEGIPGAAMGLATGGVGNAHVEPPKPPDDPSKPAGGPLARAAGAATQPASMAVDEFSQRASAAAAAVRDGSMLDAWRSAGSDVASDVLAALAVAQNPSAPAAAREQALAVVEGAIRDHQLQPAQAAGQQWQDLRRDQVIQEAGQQWADLGITDPQDDLEQQRAAAEVERRAGVIADAGFASQGMMNRKTRAMDRAGSAWQQMSPGISEEGESSGIPDSQLYPKEYAARMEQQAAEEAAAAQAAAPEAPAAAPQRRTVEPPKAAVPPGDGPAFKRQRQAQLRAAIEDGFGVVERDEQGQFWLVNPARGEQVRLANPLEAQMARKQLNDYLSERSSAASTAPTEGQKEAGNYRKGHMKVAGLDITVENPAGSTRSGTAPDGKKWESTMAHHYGYIKRSTGADGDQVDVFVGPRPDSGMVFVVDQVDPKTGLFDEHKVMLGFRDAESALAGYQANYEPGWKGAAAVTPMTLDQFRQWLKDGDQGRPMADGVRTSPLSDNPQDKSLVDALRAALKEQGRPAPDLKIAGDGPEADALRALLRAAEDSFGVHGIAVESEVADWDGTEHAGTIFINVRNPQFHVAKTVGHEMAHTQEGIFPELREKIWGMIDEAGKKAYFETYLFRRDGAKYANATAQQLEKLKSEMLADYFGGRFQDRKWLDQLAKAKPHLFGKFVQEWLQVLKKLEMSLRSLLGEVRPGSVKNVEQFITDVQAAQQLAAEAAIAWAERFQKNAANDAVAKAAASVRSSGRTSSNPVLVKWAQDYMGGARVSETMQVSSAPAVPLRMAGIPRGHRILVDRFFLSHVSKRGHGLDPELIGRLPSLLAAPRAVVVTYEKTGENGEQLVSYRPQDGYSKRVNVLVDARDDQGRPYLVGLKSGIHSADVTDVRTLFGRNNSLQYVLRAIHDGGFVYANQKEADRLKAITGSGTIPAGSAKAASTPNAPERTPQVGGQQGIIFSEDAVRQFMSGEGWERATIPLTISRKGLSDAFGVHFSARIDRIDDLGGFNVDAQMSGMDVDMDLDMVEFLRAQEDQEAQMAAQRELEAEQRAARAKPSGAAASFGVDVSDAEIEAAGLVAEEAFDDVPWKKQRGSSSVFDALVSDPLRPSKVHRLELYEHDRGRWHVSAPDTWVGPSMTEEAGYISRTGAERFAQRQMAGRALAARGFDLLDAVDAGKRKAMMDAWSQLNKLDAKERGVRRYGRVDDGQKTLLEIVDAVGIPETFQADVRLERADPETEILSFRFSDRKTGRAEEAVMIITGQQAEIESSSMKRGGNGALVYQIAAEFAARRGITIMPASSLSGVNSYRRTEQAISAAMRTGRSTVLVPHQVQRVYGFDRDASSEQDHQDNIQRLMLASMRNVAELVPEFESLSYDPASGMFSTQDGAAARDLVDGILARQDVRAMGLGRSTLARAVMTRMAMNEQLDAAKVESFAEPVLYSERERVDSEYNSVASQYRGTAQWMKAPDGSSTSLTEKQWVMVRTPSFKKWFGDWEKAHAEGGVWASNESVSKVVGKNGEPMVVYHGSDKAGFMQFNEAGGLKRGDLGVFTTNDYGMARSYVRKGRSRDVELPDEQEMLDRAGVVVGSRMGLVSSRDIQEREVWFYETPYGDEVSGFASREEAVADALQEYGGDAEPYGGVYALFLNIRDPGEHDFRGANWDGEFITSAFEVYDADGQIAYLPDGRDIMTLEEAQALAESDGWTYEPASPLGMTTDTAVRSARFDDNDGAIIYNVIDDGGGPGYSGNPQTIYVAFDPRQIKSADFNVGSFDGSSSDIRYSEREIVEPLQPQRQVKRKEVARKFRQEVGADEARGTLVSYEVEIEDTGETATVTVDAGDAIQDLGDRIENLSKLLACLAK